MIKPSERIFYSILCSLAVIGASSCKGEHLFASNDLSDKQMSEPKQAEPSGHHILKVYTTENSELQIKSPRVIFQDDTRRFWIGGDFGVQTYNYELDQWGSLQHNFHDSLSESRDGTENIPIGYSTVKIIESRDNKLWFISDWGMGDKGLTTYDGEVWKHINWEICTMTYCDLNLFLGRDGILWCTFGDKLHSYDGRQWKLQLKLSEMINDAPLRIPQKLRKTIEANAAVLDYAARHSIHSGLQDSEGYFWIGTRNSLVMFDARMQECRPYPQTGHSSIDRIYEDRTGRMWFASNTGQVYVYQKGKSAWVSYNLLNQLPPILARDTSKAPVMPHPLVQAIYQDKAGRMMFATNKGLLVFSERENKWELYTPSNSALPGEIVTSIIEDRSGRIWVGTSRGIVVLEQ